MNDPGWFLPLGEGSVDPSAPDERPTAPGDDCLWLLTFVPDLVRRSPLRGPLAGSRQRRDPMLHFYAVAAKPSKGAAASHRPLDCVRSARHKAATGGRAHTDERGVFTVLRRDHRSRLYESDIATTYDIDTCRQLNGIGASQTTLRTTALRPQRPAATSAFRWPR